MTLPIGYQVTLASGLVTSRNGHVLVGGSPLLAMRLSSRARTALCNGTITVTDGPTALLAERLLATNLGVPEMAGLPPVPHDNLTVVIPVRDRPEQLGRTLAALHPLKCLVVDDASHHPEQVAEVAHCHGSFLHQLAENVGPAGARNAGLEHVHTAYVAFVDSDVEVSATALMNLSRHFADPALVLIGPRVVAVPRSSPAAWFERYDAAASSLTLGSAPGVVRPGAAVAWLPSACLVARTKAIATGFDPGLRVGEDVDLVWRLVEAGHRVRYDPAVIALHDARPTMAGWLGRKFVYGSGGAALAARHGNKLAPAVLTPTYAAAAAALLLRSWWAAPVTLAALASGTRSVAGVLPNSPDRRTIAARLAVRGLAWAVRQESALMLRHWWPDAAVGAVSSRHIRRALVTALVVDAAAAAAERQHGITRAGPVSTAFGRRFDDLAYGAGLWWGALRAGSPRALLPRSPASSTHRQ